MPAGRIGIFGGTFDPPHFGHLAIAKKALQPLDLDELIWMVTPDPPHKQGRTITPFQYRFQMVSVCVADEPRFKVSDLESKRVGPHYTSDTLKLLQAQNPEAELVLLIGGDSLRDLHTWHEPEEILEMVTSLGVFARGELEDEMKTFASYFPEFIDKVTPIASEPIEISSSRIRKLLREGANVSAYMPAPLIAMIKELDIYSDQDVTTAEA